MLKTFRQKVTFAMGGGSLHWSRPSCFKSGRIMEGFCETGRYNSGSKELDRTVIKYLKVEGVDQFLNKKCWCMIQFTPRLLRRERLFNAALDSKYFRVIVSRCSVMEIIGGEELAVELRIDDILTENLSKNLCRE